MAATVLSITPPMRPTLDARTAPDLLRLVCAPQQVTAHALHPADDQQALRAEAFRWLRDLAAHTTL